MYFDCLLDGKMIPVHNGTPEEVRVYILKNQPFPADYQVYKGRENNLVTVDEYLESGEK